MIEPDEINRDSLPLQDVALQADLEAAIERARHRVAPPEMVERLTASVLQLTHTDERRSFAPRHLNTVWIWGGAIAAAIVLFVSYGFRQPKLPEVVQETTSMTSITKISLVSFSYSRIEEDLDRAAAKAEEVSEGLDLLCYAILSNHFHLVLRSRPDAVAAWDDSEVARRWMML